MPERTDGSLVDRVHAMTQSHAVLRSVATGLLACPDHYAGDDRHEPDALRWAAWDAYHAIRWGTEAEEPRAGILAALYDSAFIAEDRPHPPCVEGHITAILGAIGTGSVLPA